MSTTSEQLASVRALIARLETTGVEEYSAGSERTRMTQLGQLYAREKDLMQRLAAETSPIAKPIDFVDI